MNPLRDEMSDQSLNSIAGNSGIAVRRKAAIAEIAPVMIEAGRIGD